MGYHAEEMYEIFKKYCKKIKYAEMGNVVRLILGLIFTGKICIDGLNTGKKIEELINKIAKKKGIHDISDIKMPLVMPSVNLANGEVICFTSSQFRQSYSDHIFFVHDSNIGKAVRASCSYPVVFSPCPYQNLKLIDGGIRENVPWKELKRLGADQVFNIVFEEEGIQNADKNLVEVAGRSISLLCRELSNYEMEGAEEVLKIKCGKIGLLEVKKIDQLYELGYEQTMAYLQSQKRLGESIVS